MQPCFHQDAFAHARTRMCVRVCVWFVCVCVCVSVCLSMRTAGWATPIYKKKEKKKEDSPHQRKSRTREKSVGAAARVHVTVCLRCFRALGGVWPRARAGRVHAHVHVHVHVEVPA